MRWMGIAIEFLQFFRSVAGISSGPEAAFWSTLSIAAGGGGLTQKCRTCMGWGGVFGTQNTKVTCTLFYNKGGVLRKNDKFP